MPKRISPKDYNLTTREQRKRLPARPEPYYVSTNRSAGISIGYRKGATTASWYLRTFKGNGYQKREVGRADDDHPADGVSTLAWGDVLKLAVAEPAKVEALNARYSVAECFADYFTARRAKTRSLEAIYVDESRSKPFVGKFGSSQVASLTTDELRRWRDALVAVPEAADGLTDEQHRAAMRKSQATANRTWTTCRAALNHAFGSGLVDSDLAWRRIKPFENADEAETRFLSVTEANKLLGASTPHFGDFAQSTLLTGLRPGELSRLRVSQFDGTRLEVSAGKGKRRYVSLTTQGVTHFKKLTKGRGPNELMLLNWEAEPAEGEAPKSKRWTAAEWRRAMNRASAAAKLEPRATFRDLRRTYGSLLANAQATDAVIAHSLGHTDTRMVRRVYGRLLDSMVAAELQDKLPKFKANKRTSSKAA